MKELSIKEKELLLKDLSIRLSYGVICSTPKGNGHLCSINQTIFGNEYGVNIKATKRDYFNDDECDIKPYLRPISSMTEEEAKELSILYGIKNILLIKITDEYIDFVVDDGFCSTETRTIWYDEIISSIEIFDWLNAHHFDYRGLIEKGFALEAPDNMYKHFGDMDVVVTSVEYKHKL